MEVEHDETLKYRIEEVDETPHDAEAMEMQGRKRARRLMVKYMVKALKEVEPTFKRESS